MNPAPEKTAPQHGSRKNGPATRLFSLSLFCLPFFLRHLSFNASVFSIFFISVFQFLFPSYLSFILYLTMSLSFYIFIYSPLPFTKMPLCLLLSPTISFFYLQYIYYVFLCLIIYSPISCLPSSLSILLIHLSNSIYSHITFF